MARGDPTTERPGAAPPALGLFLVEGQRALLERLSLRPLGPLLRSAPRGDGHPVLLLPGFSAGDESTRVLRRYLRERGHSSHPWLLGRNLGLQADTRQRLVDRVEELHRRYDQKLSLVGWSLGGIYAREFAKRRPDLVRQVVTLGSPFGDAGRASNVRRLFELVSGTSVRDHRVDLAARLRVPPTVPSSAVYTRTDGVVHWSACREPETDHTENIEIPGSHCGLGFNPLALYAVADRLSQADGQWQPFDRKGWRRAVYA